MLKAFDRSSILLDAKNKWPSDYVAQLSYYRAESSAHQIISDLHESAKQQTEDAKADLDFLGDTFGFDADDFDTNALELFLADLELAASVHPNSYQDQLHYLNCLGNLRTTFFNVTDPDLKNATINTIRSRISQSHPGNDLQSWEAKLSELNIAISKRVIDKFNGHIILDD